MHRALLFPVGMLAALLVTSSPAMAPVTATAASQSFIFNWTGGVPPAQPVIFTGSPNWDVSIHARWMSQTMSPTLAQHGADCSAPPNTHLITQLAEGVFICNNHLMTSISDHGFGDISLTPNQIVDFSNGPATISFNVSTLHLNSRNWLTFWLSPWNENVLHPVTEVGDLLGPPRHAVRITGTAGNAGATKFAGQEVTDFQVTPQFAQSGTALEQLMPTSATVRTRFELTISRTHVRFGVPSVGLWWVDNDFPTPLSFDQAIFQTNFESYDPCKGQSAGPCSSDTWHWSNFSISPAIPFTILQGDARAVTPHTPSTVHFAAPAPAGSYLRFEAVGNNVQMGFNGGALHPASMQQLVSQQTDRWPTYWVPMAQGTTSVTLQAQNWWGGDWWIRDPTIWALAAPPAGVVAPPPTTLPAAPPATAPPVAPTPAGEVMGGEPTPGSGGRESGRPPAPGESHTARPPTPMAALAGFIRRAPGMVNASTVPLIAAGLAMVLFVLGTVRRRRRRKL